MLLENSNYARKKDRLHQVRWFRPLSLGYCGANTAIPWDSVPAGTGI
jgi:hypothetical protein